ncbi:MAG: SRPBCC domain-containing protein [Hyphomicrobiales bacterium]
MRNATSFADRELLISRHFEFPREIVYRSWVDLNLALQWWGPPESPAIHAQMDLRPGGAWSARFRAAGHGPEWRTRGIMQEVIPASRLIYTFSMEDAGDRWPDTLVTMTFVDETAAKTRVTAHQRPFRNREDRDFCRDAWDLTFDRFAACLNAAQGAMSTVGATMAAE